MSLTGGRTGSRPAISAVVIETAGTAGAVERALGVARRGGRVVLIGRAGNDAEAYQVLRDSYGPRGKVMLDIDAP